MTALYVVLVLILITAAYGGLRAAIWVPMDAEDAERAAALAGINAGDTVYDLGCGDARFLEAAAARGATAIGYEVSLIPYLLAWIRKVKSPYKKNMHLRFGDFWFADLSDADVVFVFLMKKVYPRLVKKVKGECLPGTRLLTYVWGIEGMEEVEVSEREGKARVWKYVV